MDFDNINNKERMLDNKSHDIHCIFLYFQIENAPSTSKCALKITKFKTEKWFGVFVDAITLDIWNIHAV